jgi:N5-(cytidine 5'-diphosphoramidyl)-L-glutamine hydrolase
MMDFFLIGISLRIDDISKYGEKRDAISQDWTKFLSKINAFPILIPNTLSNIQNFLEKFSLDGIILSGGDNIGDFPERDETEINILEYAIKKNIPVLGVCRGMQIINHYFGGKMIASDTKLHVNKSHSINFLEQTCMTKIGKEVMVNSFHNNLILKNNLGKDLENMAEAEDKTIEGFFHKKLPIVGVMWHPERDKNLEFELEFMKIYQEQLFWK